jgi:hypothetical protein
MKTRAALFLSIVALAAAPIASAQNFNRLGTNLIGFEEPPSISTVATGRFDAAISHDDTEIQYELSYENLEGTVMQAHIHLGQRRVNGGISVWLCGNPPLVPPPGTPACPVPSGTVTGTITAVDVIGPTGQGIAPGELAELIRAIRNGNTYVNVHSTKFPGGEIRNQVGSGETGGGH